MKHQRRNLTIVIALAAIAISWIVITMSNPIRDVEIGMTEAEVRGVMGEADEVIRIKFSLPPREEHVSSDEYRNLIAPILAQIRAKEMYYGRSVVVLNGNGKVIAVE